jgi:broad specificity phosphatase PhoE
MTNFLLIRHAAYDFVGRALAGRQPNLHLNTRGRDEAEQLAARLSVFPIDAIYSGPLERTRETAQPLAVKLGLLLQIAAEFNEIEFGDWTNRTFAELDRLPEWQLWNSFRSVAAPPNGELMLDVQKRAVRKILELRRLHKFVAIFSHGDVIRAVLIHFLGMHIDLYARIEIDCASFSLVELNENVIRVVSVNVLV